MSRVVVLMVVVGVAVSVASLVFSAGTVAERSSLKGIKPIRVVASKVRPDAAADGLSRARLHTVMETRLRTAGLPVHRNATNDLILIVSTSPQRDGFYAVHLHLELRQLVALFHEFIRDPESRGMAATWRTSWIGVLKAQELEKTETEIGKLVDQFVADWRIGNLGRRR